MHIFLKKFNIVNIIIILNIKDQQIQNIYFPKIGSVTLSTTPSVTALANAILSVFP